MFSYEFLFTSDFLDRRGRSGLATTKSTWRQCHTVRFHDRIGGESVMEWGGITVTDRTPIIVCKKGVAGHHVRRTTYRHPLARRVGRRFVFQDNTRAHRVRIVNAHLQQHNIYQMSWPAMSPDLPPIRAGPDLGLGKLDSCPWVSTTWRPPHISCHILFFGILG